MVQSRIVPFNTEQNIPIFLLSPVVVRLVCPVEMVMVLPLPYIVPEKVVLSSRPAPVQVILEER